MTKEEYESLLQSDYWKGYSYSLIKERNFTCEDCGRCYPNKRNMLHVHHLVYRDANPWSYKPEEVIVLCKECHQKRHGIYQNPETFIGSDITHWQQTDSINDGKYKQKSYTLYGRPKRQRSWFKYSLIAYILVIFIYCVVNKKSNDKNEDFMIQTATLNKDTLKIKPNTLAPKKHSVNKEQYYNSDSLIIETPNIRNLIQEIKSIEKHFQYKLEPLPLPNIDDNNVNSTTKSSLEILEEEQYAEIVKQAKRVGVSTEGSTSDILERISKKNLEKNK